MYTYVWLYNFHSNIYLNLPYIEHMSYIYMLQLATGRRFATVNNTTANRVKPAVGPKQGCQNGFEEDL